MPLYPMKNLANGISITAQTPSTGSPAITIGNPPLDTVRINPGSVVIGGTLSQGSWGGQEVTIINESANAVTFALAASSNVALGTSLTIAALSKVMLKWNNSTNLWY
jgi:hypothetical protein